MVEELLSAVDQNVGHRRVNFFENVCVSKIRKKSEKRGAWEEGGFTFIMEIIINYSFLSGKPSISNDCNTFRAFCASSGNSAAFRA